MEKANQELKIDISCIGQGSTLHSEADAKAPQDGIHRSTQTAVMYISATIAACGTAHGMRRINAQLF
jgi:hypothetical protein